MSDLREFTCFKLLSQEIQDLIWSFSFWSQTITFCIVQNATFPRGSDSPHIAMEYPPNSCVASFDTSTWFEPINTKAPAAFSICQASRAIALSKDYKTWNISRCDGKSRGLIWKPATDIIFVDVSRNSHFDIFVKQFNSQGINEIQRLAFPYEFWAYCYRTESGYKRLYSKWGEWKRRRGSHGLAQLLETPSSLRELFVMVDKEFFDSEVQGKPENQLEFWTASPAIGTGFHDGRQVALKRYGPGSSVIPKISLAWNFEMIWHGKDIGLPEC
jgi:hypothetical protein